MWWRPENFFGLHCIVAVSLPALISQLWVEPFPKIFQVWVQLSLDDEALPSLVFNSLLEQGELELYFGPLTHTNDPFGAEYRLLQNQPNPFAVETTIGFVLPGACDAQLRVFEVSGRELLRLDKAYPAGYNAEKLRLDELSASGVLYYELTTPFGVLTKSMVRAAR